MFGNIEAFIMFSWERLHPVLTTTSINIYCQVLARCSSFRKIISILMLGIVYIDMTNDQAHSVAGDRQQKAVLLLVHFLMQSIECSICHVVCVASSRIIVF